MMGDDPVFVLVGGGAATEELAREAEAVLAAALRVLGERNMVPGRSEVSISLVSPDEIRALNRDYRGKDAETDVLSFSQLEGDHSAAGLLPVDVPVPLGDIVVNIPRMRAQAVEYGHGESREFGYLLVHGLLHLLGFDHDRPDDAAAMRAAEEDVLAAAHLARDTGSIKGDVPR